MKTSIQSIYIRNIYSRFPSNLEAFASELLENLKEMFLWDYMHSDMLSLASITHTDVYSEERVSSFFTH